MPSKGFLSVLAGLLFLFAFYPYIKAIVKRETSPRKATWLIWMAGDIIIAAGMIAQGTISGQIAGAVVGATSVFILSLKYGEPGWTKHDKICISIAMLSIVLWQVFRDSNLGIGFSLLALAVAAWPTYVSAYHNPENEDKKGWIIFNLSSLVAILAIPSLTFADAAPPITFMFIDAPMLYLLFFRPRKVVARLIH